MSSLKANHNFLQTNRNSIGETDKLSTKKRSLSLQHSKPIADFSTTQENQNSSFDELLSTSSGISFYLTKVNNPQIHNSFIQRKRLINAEYEPFVLANEFKPLSMNLSELSASSFSLEVHSKKNVINLQNNPFKILDVPGIEDNYYTNLLCWSYQNQIAISLENTIYFFDYKNSDINEFYEADKLEKVTSLAFDNYGERLAMGNILGQVSIWDVERKKEIMCIDKHLDRVSCLDWTEKGLLSGSKDKNAYLNDIRMRKFVAQKYISHTQEICGIKWNCDQTRFATGGNDNRAYAWDIKCNKPIMTLKHKAGVRAVCWSAHQRDILITGGGLGDHMIKSWNMSKDKLMFSRDIEGQVCVLLYSAITNDLISSRGNPDNEIEVWRSNGFKKIGSLTGHSERPLHMALSPDGNVLLSVSSDETMRFWEFVKEKKPKCKGLLR